jgi:hypothetical protein
MLFEDSPLVPTPPPTLREYLNARIGSPNYRGVQLAQHNRTPALKLTTLLSVIYGVTGTTEFPVPKGDDPAPTRHHDSETPRPNANYEEYYDILDAIADAAIPGVTATFNSLKKNHFPNLVGMGLLVRTKGATPTARLTDAAEDIVNETNDRQRGKLIGDAMENLLGKPFIDEVYDLLGVIDTINASEMMLIVSDITLPFDVKVKYLREYKGMRRRARARMLSELSTTCQQTMNLPKVDKRDWGNWMNEARQIISALALVPTLSVYNIELVMLAGAAATREFIPVRSQKAKDDAFLWHDIQRQDGWELHHIVPMETVVSKADLLLIDVKENLLYIPAAKHHRIKPPSIKFRFDLTTIQLINPDDDTGEPISLFEIGPEAAVNRDRLEPMCKHNRKILVATE